jgi:isopenicillin-N epimerase
LPLTTPEDFLSSLWKSITPQTRLIFLSHITSPTALIFPIEEICARARKAGILTLIDGAHAPGQIPLTLDNIGADFYTGNLHKWLCAPKGSAFLYVRPSVQSLIQPFIVSWGWRPDKPAICPFSEMLESNGTRDLSAFLSVPDAIRFQQENKWLDLRHYFHELTVEMQSRIVSHFGILPLSSGTHIIGMPRWLLPLSQQILIWNF